MRWKYELVEPLLKRAQAEGEDFAQLSSLREAQLFRYAINNYRRNRQVGQNLGTEILRGTSTVRIFLLPHIRAQVPSEAAE